ncbi:pyridoxine/pyridoxamine 5'-phosphate oxidase [Streptomyces decoyicus]|uniref:pyridoxine/pyridoxamine 5'-phosphate oxidase n=1 Tax=Streptomyces decoyicus TaxID=249567 RepID=UPI00099BF7A3|nr:pyridoxal 5'-phosphate synthase [Streptomyces decoyicus]QZY16600.1 pyridoxal 5'-phosphate synthase [Streptomyces decoyicus]
MTDHPGHQDPPDAASTGATAHEPAVHDSDAHDSAAHGSDAADARAFRELLRGLRVWDVELPSFDPATAPDEPLPLFRQWLREAAEAGVPEPHTMTLATADASGAPSVRTLMLHDADERGWHFASHRGSRKGRELAVRPRAALGFYWPGVGRQVRVRGSVTAAGPEESAADLHRRSTGALAAGLVGRQSEVLGSTEELARASDAAWERARREPEAPVPSWTLYVLRAEEVEFFQGDARRRHIRLNYRYAGGRWVQELLWP